MFSFVEILITFKSRAFHGDKVCGFIICIFSELLRPTNYLIPHWPHSTKDEKDLQLLSLEITEFYSYSVCWNSYSCISPPDPIKLHPLTMVLMGMLCPNIPLAQDLRGVLPDAFTIWVQAFVKLRGNHFGVTWVIIMSAMGFSQPCVLWKEKAGLSGEARG